MSDDPIARFDPLDSIAGHRWFGDSWGAPVCMPERHVATPDSAPCAGRCGRRIGPGDQGVMLPLAEEPVAVASAGGPAGEEGMEVETRVTWLGWHLECWIREIGGPCREHGILRCDGSGRAG